MTQNFAELGGPQNASYFYFWTHIPTTARNGDIHEQRPKDKKNIRAKMFAAGKPGFRPIPPPGSS